MGAELQRHAPLEYSFLRQVLEGEDLDADIIEQIGYSSSNSYFRTGKFRRALIKYRSAKYTGRKCRNLSKTP